MFSHLAFKKNTLSLTPLHLKKKITPAATEASSSFTHCACKGLMCQCGTDGERQSVVFKAITTRICLAGYSVVLVTEKIKIHFTLV